MHRHHIALVALLLSILLATGPARAADHQECFKIKDSAAKATYRADLLPTDSAFPNALGCIVKVPAKMLCIDVDKTNVSPTPPGSDPGLPAQKSLCYKLKCPKVQPTVQAQDQFGSRSVTVKAPAYLCAPFPAPTTTTSTTTSTTTTTQVGFCNSAGDCPTPQNSTATCTASQCGFTCDAGFANCDQSAGNGCEAATATDPNNCGTCGDTCPSGPNAAAACSASQCSLVCNVGFKDCNGTPGDGCEVHTTNDPNNCGTCGNTCPSGPNSTAACSASQCGLVCSAGFLNCNGTPGDGCEVNTTTDSNNCGSCGNVCPGVQHCANSSCVP